MYLFIILHTLRNKSDTEEMKIMKNLLRKSDYVRNNDRRDPIAVLKLSDEKFIKHKKEIGFVVHTLIPKSTKFVQTNKIGMFPGPLSFPFGPYGFLFMLTYDSTTQTSEIFKTKLHNSIEKIELIQSELTANSIFYDPYPIIICIIVEKGNQYPIFLFIQKVYQK